MHTFHDFLCFVVIGAGRIMKINQENERWKDHKGCLKHYALLYEMGKDRDRDKDREKQRETEIAGSIYCT